MYSNQKEDIMTTTKWTIDPTQSEAIFSVRKLMITTVTGSFKDFEGEMETDSKDFANIRNLIFRARVDSVKTDDAKRDEHLRSADFFDIDLYPYFSFSASDLNMNDTSIVGEMTIRNITRPVALQVKFNPAPVGSLPPELEVSGKINRKDFGLTWDGKNAAGEIIVGDEIKLKARIQFTKVAARI